MKLPALLDEIKRTVEAGDSTPNSHIILAQQVSNLADMVGWADGPIDPGQEIFVRLEQLLEFLQARYGRTSEPSIAALHDALAALNDSIARHDQDLTDPGDEYDDAVDP